MRYSLVINAARRQREAGMFGDMADLRRASPDALADLGGGLVGMLEDRFDDEIANLLLAVVVIPIGWASMEHQTLLGKKKHFGLPPQMQA